MNHENVSATQAAAVGLGTIANLIWPGHAQVLMESVGVLFTLLGALKPFLAPKPTM